METIVTGKVIAGEQLGRQMGYPTANLRIDPGTALRNGVYAARVRTAGGEYNAMAYVGRKPTLDKDAERMLEAHLFGFTGDLYGKTIDVKLLQFVRGEKRFNSIESLRRQMEQDRQFIQNILQSCG